MKLARKLVLALVLGIIAVMSLNGYLRLRAERTLFEDDSLRDLRAMGRALSAGVEAVFRYDGEQRAQSFVEQVNRLRDDFNFRWAWLDDAPPSIFAPGVSPQRIERLRRGETVSFARDDEIGDHRRFMLWPLPIAGLRPAALELSESMGQERAFIRRSQLIILVTALGMSAVCGLIASIAGFWFVGRPMRLLSEKARRVGAGELTAPLLLRQRDEIGELADEINAMCDRLAAAQQRAASESEARIVALEQLRHADRLKTVGQLASGVAHELGTPLNVVSGHAGMIRRGELADGEVRSSADVIVEQAHRMASIIRKLLDFSRRRGPQLASADALEIVSSTIEMLAPLAEKSGVLLLSSAESPLPVLNADRNQIEQALANLVVNAIQATPRGNTVAVSVKLCAALPPHGVDGVAGEFVCLAVDDTGGGIAPGDLPHVFEPFFTTKDVGEGTGLGLAVAYGIVREHGGWIEVVSAPARGTRFAIFLHPGAPEEQLVNGGT